MEGKSFEDIKQEAEIIHAHSESVDVWDAKPRMGKETSPRSIGVPLPYIWMGIKSEEELLREIFQSLDLHVTLHEVRD